MGNKLSAKRSLSDPKIRAAVALLSCFLWGCVFPLNIIEYGLLGIDGMDIPELMLFAGYRFSMGGALAIIGYSIYCKRFLLPKKKELLAILLLGLIHTAGQFCLNYIGQARMYGTKCAVFTGLNPFLAILLACFIFRQERMTKRKVISCSIGFAGIVIANLNGLDISFRLAAEGIFLMSVFLGSLGNCMTKNMTKTMDAPTLNGYQMLIGGLALILAGTVMGGKLSFASPGSVSVLLALASIAAVAQLLWTILLKHNEVSTVSIFNFMSPVFGVFLSALFIADERISLLTMVALVFITVGIIISNTGKKRA